MNNYILLCAALFFIHSHAVTLSSEQLTLLANRIWQRECNKRVDGLISWNTGESFPSLGIGHFIWYPIHATGPFVQTFPDLIIFMKQKGIKIPVWLEHAIKQGCPWKNRTEFLAARQQAQLTSLQALLENTINLQAEFIVHRFHQCRDTIINAAPPEQRAHVTTQYHRLGMIPEGLFAMIDYVHFKGDGTNPAEQYNGVRWGLLQVLLAMQGEKKETALDDFITSACAVLTKRVEASPNRSQQQQWLKGWIARVQGYRTLSL